MKAGDIYQTNKWGDIVIEKYVDHKNVHIKFLNSGVERVVRPDLVVKGVVEDPTYPTRYGFGFMGIGPYSSKLNKRFHVTWKGVLERAYCPKLHNKYPTYADCSVDSQWHNFQEFAEWCQWQKGGTLNGWELDKDLLFPNNKYYSAETCCFIPKEVNIAVRIGSAKNGFLPGVYQANGSYIVCTTDHEKVKISKRFSSEEAAFYWYCEQKDEKMLKFALEYRECLDDRAFHALQNFSTATRWAP